MQAESTGIILDTPEQIAMFQLLRLRKACQIELSTGLRYSRGSVFTFLKKTYGFSGSKKQIYKQLCNIVEKADAEYKRAQSEDRTRLHGLLNVTTQREAIHDELSGASVGGK